MCVSPATVDLSTQANIDQVKTSHIHLNWNIDFETQIISGNVLLDLVSLVDNLDKVVLDTSYLNIHSVTLGEQSLKVRFVNVSKRY
jgi:leukotriene-A4 hydrolase